MTGPRDALAGRDSSRRICGANLQRSPLRAHRAEHDLGYLPRALSNPSDLTCWAVHWAVGLSVTLMWTTRRRSCATTTKTNKTLNTTVGTVKKSTETRLPTWSWHALIEPRSAAYRTGARGVPSGSPGRRAANAGLILPTNPARTRTERRTIHV